MSTHTADNLLFERKRRLVDVMRLRGIPALLTADPISILYATGARNMTVHGFTGPDRFMLLFADGPTIPRPCGWPSQRAAHRRRQIRPTGRD